MTGRAEPSKRDLEANLHKRLYIPASGPGSRKVSKRYNRHGTAVPVSSKAAASTLKAGAKAKGHGGKG